MVDWWTFDEPSGSYGDIAGSVNNVGAVNGPVARIAGEVGRAAQFNGTNTWVQVANDNEVNFLGNCANDAAEAGTIDFWINTGANQGTVTILDKRETAPNFLRGYSIYMWKGHIGFQMATGPGNSSCNSSGSACSNITSLAPNVPIVADGKWHFVAITFTRCKGAAGMFYVDGQTEAFAPKVGDWTNKSDLYIGRRVPPMGPDFLRGALDELEYWKRALPKQELDAIWQAGPAGKCRRLL
jgi:hypothetical protein